jgi:16S rRNA (uracil1498-N3)-methyltransferase
MRRFFLESLSLELSIGTILNVPDELMHRAINVLRFDEGETVEFIDGKGLVLEAKVSGAGKNKKFTVSSKRTVKREKPLIGVAVSLIRRERFDLLVEKAVELGVDNIIPLETERSRPFGTDSYPKLKERWQRIADQALSQCKRAFRCEIGDVIGLSDIKKLDAFDEKVFFHFGGEKLNRDVVKDGRSHLFIIGPEGGFSNEEVQLLKDLKIPFCSLTENILRTETAVFYVLSVTDFLSLT